MSTYSLPYFGEITINNLDDFYDVFVNLEGREVQIDLNFDSKKIDPSKLEMVKIFIENLSKADLKNKEYILHDYNDDEGDTVKFYIEHHLKEIDEDDLAKLIDIDAEKDEKEKQLLQKLKLVRVGIYPEDDENFAIFDYTISQDLTDFLVVLYIDKNGNLDFMSMES